MNSTTFPVNPILLVDDEERSLESFNIVLRSAGINNLMRCQDSRQVLTLLEKHEIALMIVDLLMPHVTGEELLSVVSQEMPGLPVIVITGVDEVEMAVRCMQLGALDYMVKPVEKSRLVSAVRRVLEIGELRQMNTSLRRHFFSGELENPEFFEEIVYESDAMNAVLQYVEVVAGTSQPVLITGETGVGKELIARALHKASGSTGEFVEVNVAGLDDNVFSDTLFGHVKGAYTGAESPRAGLVERARGGTLLLDEIGDLHKHSQVKLLRLLQDGDYYPLGSDMPRRCETRFVFATNQDLMQKQANEEFRKDLYYRLLTHHVHIPPLRERTEDIPPLFNSFLDEAAETLGKARPTPPPELYQLLAAYDWPGNVRELRAMVFDAVSHHTSRMLSMSSFKAAIGERLETAVPEADDEERELRFPRMLPTLKQIEQSLIDEAMARAGGNQAVAASMLGISRQALNRRLNLTGK